MQVFKGKVLCQTSSLFRKKKNPHQVSSFYRKNSNTKANFNYSYLLKWEKCYNFCYVIYVGHTCLLFVTCITEFFFRFPVYRVLIKEVKYARIKLLQGAFSEVLYYSCCLSYVLPNTVYIYRYRYVYIYVPSNYVGSQKKQMPIFFGEYLENACLVQPWHLWER